VCHHPPLVLRALFPFNKALFHGLSLCAGLFLRHLRVPAPGPPPHPPARRLGRVLRLGAVGVSLEEVDGPALLRLPPTVESRIKLTPQRRRAPRRALLLLLLARALLLALGGAYTLRGHARGGAVAGVGTAGSFVAGVRRCWLRPRWVAARVSRALRSC